MTTPDTPSFRSIEAYDLKRAGANSRDARRLTKKTYNQVDTNPSQENVLRLVMLGGSHWTALYFALERWEQMVPVIRDLYEVTFATFDPRPVFYEEILSTLTVDPHPEHGELECAAHDEWIKQVQAAMGDPSPRDATAACILAQQVNHMVWFYLRELGGKELPSPFRRLVAERLIVASFLATTEAIPHRGRTAATLHFCQKLCFAINNLRLDQPEGVIPPVAAGTTTEPVIETVEPTAEERAAILGRFTSPPTDEKVLAAEEQTTKDDHAT